MVDVSRDPRWGRMAECYGESVLLNADFGVAAVQGYQGQDLADENSIAACAKHFAGYGAAEGGRDYNTTEISLTTLNDVYLPPFEALTKAGCQTFMTSFNEISGVPSCANESLLADTLRDAWGFDGFVVTDWAAVWELTQHGVAADRADATKQSLLAGSDMDMVAGCYVDTLADLVRSGQVSEQAVRQAAERIIVVKFRLGLFDQPYTRERTVDRTEHQAAARQAVAQCAILLENDGVLPLSDAPSQGQLGHLAVVGPMAQATTDLYGTWTLDGEPEGVTNIAEALTQQLAPSWTVHTPAWHDVSGMAQAAQRSDVVIAVVGETPSRSGEANSVVDPGLPVGQAQWLEELVQLGIPVVAVVISGRATVLPPVMDRCAAVLFSFHPGSEGGWGLADVLCGKSEPGGRLPVTLPRHQGQIPIYHDHRPTGRPLHEYHRQTPQSYGHRPNRYCDDPGAPRYRFGYGLTYTHFDLSQPSCDISDDGHIIIGVQVANAGSRRGSTVVQVYLRDPVAETSQPVRRLVGYRRITLDAGAQQSLTIEIPREQLAYTHRDGQRRVDGGEYEWYVGQYASDGVALKMDYPAP